MLSLLPLPNELVVAVVAAALKIRNDDVNFEAVVAVVAAALKIRIDDVDFEAVVAIDVQVPRRLL